MLNIMSSYMADMKKVYDDLIIINLYTVQRRKESDDINHVSEQFNPHYSENVGLQCHYQGQN